MTPVNERPAPFVARQSPRKTKGAFSFLKSGNRTPAITAAVIQCISLLIVMAAGIAYSVWAEASPDIALFVMAQAIICVLLARYAGMAIWWRYIHFAFPITIWLLSSLHIPSTFYLWGFIISSTLYWTTYRSQVPFFPSRPMVWHQVSAILPKNRSVRIIDIGSGIGDLAMSIARSRPDCKVYGIEIAPLPWLISYLRSRLGRSRAEFFYGNYETLNFADYDVIFAYLSPAVMQQLWQKASREMQQQSMLISYEFPIPGISPSQTLQAKAGAAYTYIYKIQTD